MQREGEGGERERESESERARARERERESVPVIAAIQLPIPPLLPECEGLIGHLGGTRPHSCFGGFEGGEGDLIGWR